MNNQIKAKLAILYGISMGINMILFLLVFSATKDSGLETTTGSIIMDDTLKTINGEIKEDMSNNEIITKTNNSEIKEEIKSTTKSCGCGK